MSKSPFFLFLFSNFFIVFSFDILTTLWQHLNIDIDFLDLSFDLFLSFFSLLYCKSRFNGHSYVSINSLLFHDSSYVGIWELNKYSSMYPQGKPIIVLICRKLVTIKCIILHNASHYKNAHSSLFIVATELRRYQAWQFYLHWTIKPFLKRMKRS